jgi:hypothetical protein
MGSETTDGEYSCSRSTRLPKDVGSALSLLSCASLDAWQDAICVTDSAEFQLATL